MYGNVHSARSKRRKLILWVAPAGRGATIPRSFSGSTSCQARRDEKHDQTELDPGKAKEALRAVLQGIQNLASAH